MLQFKRFMPFANRVLVRKFEPLQKTKGGIILSSSSQEEQHHGTIVACGPGKVLENGTKVPMSVKVGQTVLLPGYSGSKITMGDSENYFVYRDEDIVGVLEEPTK